jgi:hypothetical protein
MGVVRQTRTTKPTGQGLHAGSSYNASGRIPGKPLLSSLSAKAIRAVRETCRPESLMTLAGV